MCARSRLTRRYQPCRFIGVALLALSILLPAAFAKAQTTIWSATLTVSADRYGYHGCSSEAASLSNCSSATTLTDDNFVHNGRTYTIVGISLFHTGELDVVIDDLSLENGLTSKQVKKALAALTLIVDGTEMPINGADVRSGGMKFTYRPDPSWKKNDTVSLKLEGPPGVPLKPTGLTATAKSETQINLSWTAPVADTTRAAVTGYKLQVSQDEDSWTNLHTIKKGATNTYRHKRLSAGETRHYRVRATSSSGNGPWSATASATTHPATPPNKPTGLQTRVIDPKDILLYWDDPADNTIIKHQYRQKVDSAAWGGWTNIPNSAQDGRNGASYLLEGKVTGSAYRFRVRAVNLKGNSPQSDIAGPVSLGGGDSTAPTVNRRVTGYFSDVRLAKGLPGPVKAGASIVTKIEFSENMKHVKGNAPTARPELFHRIGTTDTQYNVLNSDESLTSGDCKPNHASNTNVYVCLYIVGTSDNGSFTVKVGTNSADKADNALASAFVFADTLTVDSAGPSIVFPSKPAAPRVGIVSTITLTDTGTKISKYGAIVVDGGTASASNCDTAQKLGNNNLTTNAQPISPTNFSYAPPVNSEGDKVCVYAEDAVGNTHSALWPTAVFGTVGTIEGLKAKSGPNRVTLSWTNPATCTKPDPKCWYWVRHRVAGGSWTAWSETAYSRIHGVHGLSNGKTYEFQLERRDVGVAVARGSVSAAIAAAPPTPSVLKADTPQKNMIRLTWSKPGGSPRIDKYVIDVSADSGATWSHLHTTAHGGWSHHQHTGLSGGAARHYRVKARNTDGDVHHDSAWSNTATATAIGAAAPARPSNVTATGIGLGVALGWDNPNDAAITGYEYQQSDNDTPNGQFRPFSAWTAMTGSGAATTTYTVQGLNAGVYYSFRIRALKDALTSVPSRTAGAVPTSVQRQIQPPAPALSWARVHASELALRFDATLDENSVPATAAFSVVVAGSSRDVSALAVSQDTVTLTLLSAVSSGEIVSVGYAPPATNMLRAPGGGAVVTAFSGQTVTNDTPARQTQQTPLTATVSRAPADHKGKGSFVVRIAFSEAVAGSAKSASGTMSVSGGNLARASRDGSADRWALTVRPNSLEPVTLTLPATTDCAATGAVCTEDDRPLSHALSATIIGPATLAVADARADEATGATVDFVVSLSRATKRAVSVRYATQDGTATAGEDYKRKKGKLTFAVGETSKTVSVKLLDDAVDEGEESFTLALSRADGAAIVDGEATGTVVNSDPLPKAWLARFGRAASDHAVDALERRMHEPPQAELRARFGTQPVGSSENRNDVRFVGELANSSRIHSWSDPAVVRGANPGIARTHAIGGFDRDLDAVGNRTPLRDLLLGSSFRASIGSEENGGRWLTTWGDVAATSFEDETDGLALAGDVTSLTFGGDAAWRRWLAGMAVSHSLGRGSYGAGGIGEGDFESQMTMILPYMRYSVNDRLSAWGTFGFGDGNLDLRTAGGIATDIGLRTAAAGARGVFLRRDDGLEFAGRLDGRIARTISVAATGPTGNLVATASTTSRTRLALEGTRPLELGVGRVLTPMLEVGMLQDGGDAENGAGVEVGGSLAYADAMRGLSVEVRGRTLATHADDAYREWGASANLRFDPGISGQGFSLSFSPQWGASGMRGIAQHWSGQGDQALVAGRGFDPSMRMVTDIGYGMAAFRGRGTMKPFLGALHRPGMQETRLGVVWSLRTLEFGVAASHATADLGLTFKSELTW